MSRKLGSNMVVGWIDKYNIEGAIELCVRKKEGADEPGYVSTGPIELTQSLRCDNVDALYGAIRDFAPSHLSHLRSAISNIVTWIIPGAYCSRKTTPQWDRWLYSWKKISRGLANVALCNWLKQQKYSVEDIIAAFVAWRTGGMTTLNYTHYDIDIFCSAAGLPDEFRDDFRGSLCALSSSKYIAGIIKAMMSIEYGSYAHSKEISDLLRKQLEELVCSNAKNSTQTKTEKDDAANAALLESLPGLKAAAENPAVTKALDAIKLAATDDVGWEQVILTGVKVGFDGNFERFAVAMSGQRRAVSGKVAEQIVAGNIEFNLRRDTLFTMLHTLGMKYHLITAAIRNYEDRKVDGKFADPSFSLQGWHRRRNGANSWFTRKRKPKSNAKSKSKKSMANPKVRQYETPPEQQSLPFTPERELLRLTKDGFEMFKANMQTLRGLVANVSRAGDGMELSKFSVQQTINGLINHTVAALDAAVVK